MGLLNKLSTKARGIREIGLAGLVSAGIALGSPVYVHAQEQNQNKPAARVRTAYDCEHAIRSDYSEREHDWRLYKEQKQNPQPVKQNFGDKISNTNQGGVWNIGKDRPDYDPEIRLSEDYSAEDFAKAYGIAKWNLCLSEKDKQKIKQLFGKMNLEDRKSLCSVYDKTPVFYETCFSDTGKKRFEKFNQAYKYLVEKKPEKTSESFQGLKNTEMFLRKSKNSGSEIFVSKDELAKGLKESYPWINLNSGKPLNVADRVLVLWYIDHLERNLGKKIVNWDSVEKYSKMPFEEEF